MTDADVSVPVADAGRNGASGADKAKSATQIRKDREAKQNAKMKNMKKGDRRHLERKDRSHNKKEEGANEKGFQGKKGKSGRWKK